MKILLSGYEKNTHQLMFRVYAQPLAGEAQRQNHRNAHFAALDLLSAALLQDFGLRHAVIHRIGLGKPKLMHDFLHINLSHCKGLAVAAAGLMPLGVDAEAPRKIRETLAAKVCTAEELAQIAQADDKNHAFLRFWTLKEAYAKYTGEGIGLHFDTLGFTLSQSDHIIFHHPDADDVCFEQIIFDGTYPVSLCRKALPDIETEIAIRSSDTSKTS